VLRTRLFLNLMPFVVILLAIGVYAIVLFSRLANSVDASVTEKYRSVMAAQAMTLALAGMDREVPWISGGERNPDSHAFAEHQKQFEENLAIELKSLMLPGEKELSQELASQYHTFQEAMGRISALRKSEAQHQVYDDEITPSVRTMNSLLEKIRDLNHEAVLSTSQSIQRITRDVTRLMLIGMVIALVISAYACLQLSRSILRPIQSLTQASRELGEGNLGQLVPVLSRDELGDLAVAFNKMAAQLQEYRQSTTDEIVRLHRTMETTLASFPDPIFVLNKDGRIDLKNPAAADLASNLHLKDCLPERLAAIAQKALQSGENFLPHSFDEVVSFRFNGEEKFLLPRILAMRTKDDALFGVAVVLYILLEETVGGLTAKQRELLITARSDADRLLRILNDLLDLTRLEEGNAGLHKEPIATADLVQSASKEMNDQAAAKGLKLNCIVDPQLPAVSVDRQRINHVFTNLIANAIKHSPAGGEIVLRAALAEDNDVQFSITDQGPGIPEEYHTRIFERFFRVPGQSKSGAGLGLSIAREITLAHGGRIGVKSAIGQGSSFYVVLKGQRT